jgi:heavy metal translocating P-type ATPase
MARDYCCAGCETVYAIVNGLETAAADDGSYAFLDDPEFLKLYAIDAKTMEFYLDGVHCAACLWLVEKIPSVVPGVAAATLDLGRAVATITLAPGGSFAPAARQLALFGFKPHAVKDGDADVLVKKENRKLLIRLGVAAACTMNIMLFAVALFSGAAGEWTSFFAWASFAFFLPILLYSAVPFYASSFAALRAKKMSIDIPIVVGIVVGTALGFYNLFHPEHAELVYFDSLATLIFLLLSSRYLVRRAQQRSLGTAQLVFQMMPASCRRWNASAGRYDVVPVESLRHGDTVELRPGDIAPADGVVMTGESEMNNAVLSGEARPEPVAPGSSVYAGTLNVSGRLELHVETSGAATRVGQLMKMVQDAASQRTAIANIADRISGWFTAVILLLGAGTFAYWARTDFHGALNNTMALFIVSCPCALAMSAPVASLVSMGRAAKKGMLIKSPDVFEKLTQVKEVFLDKTGTLTEGQYGVLDSTFTVSGIGAEEQAAIEAAVLALESTSNHPVALSIVKYLRAKGVEVIEPQDLRERIGYGVAGRVNGVDYEVRRHDGPATLADGEGIFTRIAVLRAGNPVATFRLGDRLRADSPAAVADLQRAGVKAHLLSGDAPEAVAAAAAQLGLPAEQTRARVSPEEKLATVRDCARSAMVGDGVNDSAALAAAHVGIAVHGGMEASLRAADVYLLQPGVAPVARLLRASRETVAVIYRNFGFSLVYNVIGVSAAMAGLMSPLMAAILMPISSLTILTSSVWGARSLR